MRAKRLHESDELAVDRAIHVLGVLAGALGSSVLVSVALLQLDRGSERWAIIIYSVCLMAMLCCSAA